MSAGDSPGSRQRLQNTQWLWLSAAVIVLDQVVKQLVVDQLALFRPVVITGWLNVMHVRNTGAAFSLLSSAPAWFFAGLGAGVALLILIWLWRHPFDQRVCAASLALIAGGALGNAIDRVARGFVVDYVDFHLGGWHYPAFNIADSAIVLGAAMMIGASLWPQRAPRANGAPRR